MVLQDDAAYFKHKKLHKVMQQCGICKFKTKNQEEFRLHIITHRGTRVDRKCSICKEVFNSSISYAVHRRKIHCLYECRLCLSEFNNKIEWNAHCTHTCKFRNRNRLLGPITHPLVQKQAPKPRKIEVNERYVQTPPVSKADLTKDKVLERREEQQGTKAVKKVVKAKRLPAKLLCYICDKRLGNKKQLKYHVAKHLGIPVTEITDENLYGREHVWAEMGLASDPGSVSSANQSTVSNLKNETPPTISESITVQPKIRVNNSVFPPQLSVSPHPVLANSAHKSPVISHQIIVNANPHYKPPLTSHQLVNSNPVITPPPLKPLHKIPPPFPPPLPVFPALKIKDEPEDPPSSMVEAVLLPGQDLEANIHKSRSRFRVSRRVNCDICQLSFKNLTALKMHEKYKHSTLRCPACDYTSGYNKKLYAHQAKHHPDKFRCKFRCLALFDTKEEIVDHIKKVHKKDDLMKCRYCGTRYISGSYSQHVKQCTEDPIVRHFKPCMKCGKEFLPNDMVRHIEECYAGTVPPEEDSPGSPTSHTKPPGKDNLDQQEHGKVPENLTTKETVQTNDKTTPPVAIEKSNDSSQLAAAKKDKPGQAESDQSESIVESMSGVIDSTNQTPIDQSKPSDQTITSQSETTSQATGNRTELVTGDKLLPISENKGNEPASENKGNEPASESKRDEPASESKRDEPASESKRDEPASESKRDEPASESKRDEPESEGNGVEMLVKFQCHLCKKLFNSSEAGTNHLLTRHKMSIRCMAARRIQECFVCGKSFKCGVGQYCKHIMEHYGDANDWNALIPIDLKIESVKRRCWICNISGAAYTRYHITYRDDIIESYLTKNVEQVNVEKEGEVFQCTMCEESFPHRYSFWNHIKIHFGGLPVKKIKGGKRFKCIKCSQKFKKRSELLQHLGKHIVKKVGNAEQKISQNQKTSGKVSVENIEENKSQRGEKSTARDNVENPEQSKSEDENTTEKDNVGSTEQKTSSTEQNTSSTEQKTSGTEQNTSSTEQNTSDGDIIGEDNAVNTEEKTEEGNQNTAGKNKVESTEQKASEGDTIGEDNAVNTEEKTKEGDQNTAGREHFYDEQNTAEQPCRSKAKGENESNEDKASDIEEKEENTNISDKQEGSQTTKGKKKDGKVKKVGLQSKVKGIKEKKQAKEEVNESTTGNYKCDKCDKKFETYQLTLHHALKTHRIYLKKLMTNHSCHLCDKKNLKPIQFCAHLLNHYTELGMWEDFVPRNVQELLWDRSYCWVCKNVLGMKGYRHIRERNKYIERVLSSRDSEELQVNEPITCTLCNYTCSNIYLHWKHVYLHLYKNLVGNYNPKRRRPGEVREIVQETPQSFDYPCPQCASQFAEKSELYKHLTSHFLFQKFNHETKVQSQIVYKRRTRSMCSTSKSKEVKDETAMAVPKVKPEVDDPDLIIESFPSFNEPQENKFGICNDSVIKVGLWQCKGCIQKFGTVDEVLEHALTLHKYRLNEMFSETLECFMCGANFIRGACMCKHIAKHYCDLGMWDNIVPRDIVSWINKRNYCWICKLHLTRDLNPHVDSRNKNIEKLLVTKCIGESKDGLFHCSLCNLSFKFRLEFWLHMKRHFFQPPVNFKSLVELYKEAEQSVLQQTKRLQCNVCSTTFTDQNELYKHLVLQHFLENTVNKRRKPTEMCKDDEVDVMSSDTPEEMSNDEEWVPTPRKRQKVSKSFSSIWEDEEEASGSQQKDVDEEEIEEVEASEESDGYYEEDSDD